MADDFFDRFGIFHVVEIAEDNYFCIRIFRQPLVNDAAQNFRLAQPLLGFVGFGRGELRFQMRGDKREVKIWRGLDCHLRKTAFDLKTLAVQQEKIVRVRMPRHNGKFAQHGNMNAVIKTLDVFPKWKILSVGLERRAEFQERVGRAHFFERDHVGIHGADAFANFRFGLGGFDLPTRVGRLVEIIFHIVSCDAESAGEGVQAGQ